MVQSSFHVPETYTIDPNRVQALLNEFIVPQDQHEAYELILESLLIVQEHYGWVSREAAQAIALHLHVPLARVFELVTFYGDFRLTPPGEHRLQLCDGTACHAMGTPAVREAIEAHLGVAAGETTPDGQVTFDLFSTCLGVCDLAPLGLIDGRYFPKLSPSSVGPVIAAAVARPRVGGSHGS